MKLILPDIVPAAKSRPLSFHPVKNLYIYYDDVLQGKAKLYPIEKLKPQERIKLAVERELTNEPTTRITLNGQSYTNEQIAGEIEKQTKIGQQFLDMDLNYLEFYLSQFPENSFEH